MLRPCCINLGPNSPRQKRSPRMGRQPAAASFVHPRGQNEPSIVPLKKKKKYSVRLNEQLTRSSFKIWEGEAPAEPNVARRRLSRSFARPKRGFETAANKQQLSGPRITHRQPAARGPSFPAPA